MMRIIVVSDTHSHEIPGQLLEEIKRASLVIHAGDICDADVLKQIKGMNEVQAVYGNMDDATLRKKLPRRIVLQCEDVRIGVFHGEGPKSVLVQRVKNEFCDDGVNVVVFGHSHQPFNEKIDDILFLNPGSPNDRIFAPYYSYGVIEVDGDAVKAEIIKVK